MRVRRGTDWKGRDPEIGRNRVLKGPNQLTPEMLWNQHRLATVPTVTPTVPRGTASSDSLPDGVAAVTGDSDNVYVLDHDAVVSERASCAWLDGVLSSLPYLAANYRVGGTAGQWYWRFSEWNPGGDYTLDTYRGDPISSRGWSAQFGNSACDGGVPQAFTFGGISLFADPYQHTFPLGADAKYAVTKQSGTSGFLWTVFVDAAAYGA